MYFEKATRKKNNPREGSLYQPFRGILYQFFGSCRGDTLYVALYVALYAKNSALYVALYAKNSGLAAIHAAGVIHGDVYAHNVVFVPASGLGFEV